MCILFEESFDIVLELGGVAVVGFLAGVHIRLEVVPEGLDLVLLEVQALVHDVYHGRRLRVVVEGVRDGRNDCRGEAPTKAPGGDKSTAVLV